MCTDGALSSAAVCKSADNSASSAVTNRLNIASKHTNNCLAIYRFLPDTQFGCSFPLSGGECRWASRQSRQSFPTLAKSTALYCFLLYPTHRTAVNSSGYSCTSSLKCFFQRGSLLRGSADAGSRRAAARSAAQPASSEGRAIQRPFTRHPFLFLLFPFPFFLPISDIANIRHCYCI